MNRAEMSLSNLKLILEDSSYRAGTLQQCFFFFFWLYSGELCMNYIIAKEITNIDYRLLKHNYLSISPTTIFIPTPHHLQVSVWEFFLP